MQIYIVLTRTQTILSGLIHRVTGDEYTHAALSLDMDLNQMFSFGRRYTDNPFIGCFRRERLDSGVFARQKQLPGLVFAVPVTAAEYERATAIVEDFLRNNHRYGYNYMGLMNGLLGVENHTPNRFLCSEFVYHVLHSCGICDFGVSRNLVRPQDLLKADGTVLYKGDLKQYARQMPVYAPLRALPLERVVA